nr:protein CC2D2B isoform X3 [Callithrix jacchus]
MEDTKESNVKTFCSTNILAILGFASIIAVIALLAVGLTQNKALPENVKYGIVLDAGSSHTSLYIYKWPAEKENDTGVVHQVEECRVKGPGISKYVQKVNEIGMYLTECMERAREVIPRSQHQETPVYLGATAGMRLLRMESEELADRVLGMVERSLSNYPFDFQGARIITGQEEGAYGWITINYLLGKFSQKRRWFSIIPYKTDNQKTFGALDLGGASTQITFVPQNQTIESTDNALQFRLYGKDYNIYTHSFLCYGKDQALWQKLAKDIQVASNEILRDPCFHPGYKKVVNVSDLYKTPCTKRFEMTLPFQQFEIQGTGNYQQCHQSILELFNTTYCPYSQCAFNGIFLPPLQGDFGAFSAFYFVMNFLNFTSEKVSQAKVTEMMKKFCSQPWEEIKTSFTGVKEKYLSEYCFSGTYILSLLLQGYHFTADSWEHIHFIGKLSEEMDHVTAEEIRDKHLQKDLDAEENQNVVKTLRGKVREKQKNSKINKDEKSSTEQLIDSKIYQRTKTEVSLDESLSFFILSGEERSALDKSSEQRPVNHSYPKCFSLGGDLQNVDESEDGEFMKEFILTDLVKVKAAEYEDDQEQIKKQKANIFVPSSSPVVNQRKLPKDMMPRILEDEGFYIQRKPEIRKKTCNKMENRLLKLEEGKRWFGESGEILSLPTPIKQSWNFRLNIRKESLNPLLKTIYRKAVKCDLGSSFMNKIEGPREIYQLDLNIVGLQFSHHHLFNQEQVLCARLLHLYECFQDRQQQNVSQLLYEKLKALTDATKLSNENSEINQLTRKSLQDYNWQISNTKQLYDLERGKDLSLLRSILRTWKQIKSLRQHQGFTSTPIKLQVQRIKINKCDEQEQISEMSETEKKTEGKELKNGKKQESLSYLASDETEIERMKPITLRPQLSFTAELTSLSKCSLHEQKRRAKIQKLKYFIKIFYNNKQVSCTSISTLQLDFKVTFQQIFNIQLIYWPEVICLEVYEKSKRTSLLAKLYLPLPNYTEVKGKNILEYVEFSSHKLVMPADGEVGSNVPFLLEGNGTEELCLLTSGKLSYSLSWSLDKNGIPLKPLKSQSLRSAYCSMLRNVDARGVPGIPWLINEQKLFEWANEVRIDPNNPEYSDLMEFVMYMSLKGQDIPKYFRLEQLQNEFNFVSEEEMEKSKRFQLLQLRNAGQLDNFLLQQMPLHDTEIPDLVFQEYESQKEKEVSISDVNSIIAQRINSANFLKKVRRLIMKRTVKITKYNLSDIVTDYEKIISTSQLTDAVFKFVEPRRKLKPQRKERKQVTAQTISDGDIKILVRIVRAYNIPMRKTAINRALDMSTHLKSSISFLKHKETIKSVASEEILRESVFQDTVYPFVEVSFQHTVYQTSTASGSHPCWNEEIKVDFLSPGHDYSFSSLSKIKDNIYINIFDEMMIEKHEDHCLKSCSVHSYIRKNWLGSIVFPFSALLQQSEISGTFQVTIPPVLLGYTWNNTYVFPREDSNEQNLKECTFLNIFATIEPQISYVTYNPTLDKFLDQTEVLQRAQIFKKNCKAIFPNRRIVTTVFNDEGIQFLVTRYIKALNPPQQLLDIFLHDSNATLDLIARFVSLIPFMPDTPEENDGSDIWMTSEHCISLAIGNKEEHAVLLCNFFLYFGKKALVLLGTSGLEGHVAYVLTQETNEYLLWNPSTGQCYKQFDPFCPLKSVDCLFDDRNVWFNIQQSNIPMAVLFDYSKESFWKPLLPKNVQGTKVQSIQPEEIIYSETDKSMVEDLRNRIERTLKNKVMEWRPKCPTRWNRQCTLILRHILPKLELGRGSFVSSEGDNEFDRILQFYWVTGFPIRMPYTDVQSVIDAVYQTGIHSAEFPQTEFAIAVYIHPYPNNILSVWVYLASLVHHQ